MTSWILFTLIGCRSAVSATQLSASSTPHYLSTATPAFTRYTSVLQSGIHLEFTYPSSWGFGDTLRDNQILISLYDPRFSTLPTAHSDNNHPPINDFAVIDIWIRPLPLDKSFEQFIQARAEDTTYDHKTLLNNYQTRVSGINATVLEYRLDENYLEIHQSEMFVKEMHFATNGFLYGITLTIAEKDRGNELERGYEYFLRSLKIIK